MSAPFYAAGSYACKIVGQALSETGTGKPQFVLRFKVMGLVDPEDSSRFIPAQQQFDRSHYRTITDKTIPYFVEDLKALGFSVSSFKELDSNTPGFQDMRGREVEMECAHENDLNGESREKWGVARTGSGTFEVKPLEPKKLRDLDNLFGKHLKGLKSSPPATAPQPVAVGPGITDDDIPF